LNFGMFVTMVESEFGIDDIFVADYSNLMKVLEFVLIFQGQTLKFNCIETNPTQSNTTI